MNYRVLLLITALALGSSPRSRASSADEVRGLQRSLKTVPLPELPGKAAQIVRQSRATPRGEIAAAVVRTVAAQRPGAVVAVVATISAAAPDAASSAAAAAALENPREAAAIARVATAAAPEFAEEIAEKTGQPKAALHANNNNNGKGNQGRQEGGNAKAAGPGKQPPAHGVVANRPGTIRGKRPAIPPGLVRDPKPGRDPDRESYGRPR